MLKGQCNCGAVRFEVSGDIRAVSACHCTQCRGQSGGVWHSAVAQRADVAIHGVPRWYRSSSTAQRGFCDVCGAFLFWDLDGDTELSFSLGALQSPTGLTLQKHIFTNEKGDYYTIADDVLQEEQENE